MYLSKLINSYISTFRGFSRDCYFGFVVCLMESIFIGIYYYLSLYLVDTLHFDIPTSGVIVSCYGIGAIFGGMIGGKFSDWSSPGLASTYSLFIQAAAYLALALVTSPVMLMLNVFILGVASYGFITANHLFILGNCHEGENQRLNALSILSMASNLGLGVSAVILGSMLFMGFQQVFLVISFSILVLAIVSAYYEFESRQSAMLVSPVVDDRWSPAEMNVQYKPDRSVFIMTLINVFFVGMIVTQSSSTYAIYIKEIFPESGIQAVTILFTLNSLIVVMASTLLCDYIKDFSKIIMLGVGGFLIGFGMTILSFSHLFSVAVLSCVVNTIGEIMFFAVAQLLCYQSGLDNKKGTSLGIYRVVYASSRVLGPVCGSWIYFKTSGDMLWVICGVIGAASLVACVALYLAKLSNAEKMAETLQSI